MEFDKNKVFTAANADELEIGSTVVLADELQTLKEKVDDEITDILEKIGPESESYRFKGRGETSWHLAYLVEEPRRDGYRPYKAEDFLNEDGTPKFGNDLRGYSLYDPIAQCCHEITGQCYRKEDPGVYVYGEWIEFDELFDKYLQMDGTPFGVKL